MQRRFVIQNTQLFAEIYVGDECVSFILSQITREALYGTFPGITG